MVVPPPPPRPPPLMRRRAPPPPPPLPPPRPMCRRTPPPTPPPPPPNWSFPSKYTWTGPRPMCVVEVVITPFPPPPPPKCLGTGCGRGLPRHRRSSLKPSKPQKVHLIDLRRANNTEIMLTKVKMPLPDIIAAILTMDESVLDVDQIDNLIKFCPTKEEMELLKNFTGDPATLGKCEQHFLQLMKVPRVETKLRVYSFKIQFDNQITEFKRSLNTVNSTCEELRTSQKLKEILKKIIYMENTLNQETARGSPVEFSLAILRKLSDTRAPNREMTMHHLCKVLASEASDLLDFHKDLESLESASKIRLTFLAEEVQAIVNGLEKLNRELTASEKDGYVSEVFHKTLKDFITFAETEVATLWGLYAVVDTNADALVLYFGEDPNRCSFEQVIVTLLDFIRLFKKAREDNVKQAKLEKAI